MNRIFKENISLKEYNTFGIDVKAKYFAEYSTIAELQDILKTNMVRSNSFLHIGAGSNLLFINDFDGLILHSRIQSFEILTEDEQTVFIRVGAGVLWDDFVKYCVENHFVGVENLSLIPGEVGASAVQNIGAYGVEVKDVIHKVETIDIQTLEVKQFSNKECQYGYRTSFFKKEQPNRYIITHVTFQLSKKENFVLDYSHLKENILEMGEISLKNIRNTIIKIRESKLPDPQKLGNAGSFFMNPIIEQKQLNILKKDYPNVPFYLLNNNKVKIPAGWLIEQAGLKGKRFGNVGIHTEQALVIVNYHNATGKEVKKLSELVQEKVKAKFNISLTPEVIFIE